MNIEKILNYAKTLVGAKYTWWKGGELNKHPYPFYLTKQTKKYIFEHGVNCAGFINLLVLKNGGSIPHEGGTGAWFHYLKNKKVLEPFDYRKKYELGTLFLRKYRDVNDQGHVAVLYKNQKDDIGSLYGEIIYSAPVNGVEIEPLGCNHFCSARNGYYEFVVKPENWLLTK